MVARKSTKPVTPEKPVPRDEWDELFGTTESFEYWLNQALKQMKPEGPTQ